MPQQKGKDTYLNIIPNCHRSSNEQKVVGQERKNDELEDVAYYTGTCFLPRLGWGLVNLKLCKVKNGEYEEDLESRILFTLTGSLSQSAGTSSDMRWAFSSPACTGTTRCL